MDGVVSVESKTLQNRKEVHAEAAWGDGAVIFSGGVTKDGKVHVGLWAKRPLTKIEVRRIINALGEMIKDGT